MFGSKNLNVNQCYKLKSSSQKTSENNTLCTQLLPNWKNETKNKRCFESLSPVVPH